jgi:hypothetical protein
VPRNLRRQAVFDIDCDGNGSNGSKAAILALTNFNTQPYPTAAGNDPRQIVWKGL